MIDIILPTLVFLLMIVSLILIIKSAMRFRGRFLAITIGVGAVAGFLANLALDIMWGIIAILLVLLLGVIVLVDRQKPPDPPSQD